MQSKTRGSSPEKTVLDSKMIIVGAKRDRNLYVAAEQLVQQGTSWILTGPAANVFWSAPTDAQRILEKCKQN